MSKMEKMDVVYALLDIPAKEMRVATYFGEQLRENSLIQWMEVVGGWPRSNGTDHYFWQAVNVQMLVIW
jgi:hypothetical protein